MAEALATQFERISLDKPTREKRKDEPTREEKKRFNELASQGKALMTEQRLREALKAFKAAHDIVPHPKIASRIAELETATMSESEEDSESDSDSDDVAFDHKFVVERSTYDKLYSYQRAGLRWLYGLVKADRGGILGDDMGLGKTVQIVALCKSLMECNLMDRAMIVMPTTVMDHWQKEFRLWAPRIPVYVYVSKTTPKQKQTIMSTISHAGGICLTTYGLMTTTSKDDFVAVDWDLAILDEGHQIRNRSSKTHKGLAEVPAKQRIILTGTPIQNNLIEFYTLFTFTTQEDLLGTITSFKADFESTIVKGRKREATDDERARSQAKADELQTIIRPYMLRRTKKEVLGADSSDGAAVKLGLKTDLVLWVFLSQAQLKLYKEFLSQDEIKDLLAPNAKQNPLVHLTVLKKICDHPRLAPKSTFEALGLDEGLETAYDDLPDADSLIDESGKVGVIADLLDRLKREGHRTLVFSVSLVMLDIIQKVLRARGHLFLRVDGNVNVSLRMKIIGQFEEDKRYSVLLLSTRVSSLGLNLTMADRAIIVDPSWNPTVDAQAVDRVYRLGQKKDVVVYRMITCGSVEEKIFRRQVFKDSLAKQTMGVSKDPTRYFTSTELKELLVVGNTSASDTQIQLEQLHPRRTSTDDIERHLAYVEQIEGVFGLSDHSLLFSVDSENVGAPAQVAPKSRVPVPVPVAPPPRLAPKQNLKASLTPVVAIEDSKDDIDVSTEATALDYDSPAEEAEACSLPTDVSQEDSEVVEVSDDSGDNDEDASVADVSENEASKYATDADDSEEEEESNLSCQTPDRGESVEDEDSSMYATPISTFNFGRADSDDELSEY